MFMVNVRDREAVSPWFILGVLNSSLIRQLWLDRYYDQRETFPKIKGAYLKELPIAAIREGDDALEERAGRIAEHAEALTQLYGELPDADPRAEVILRRRIAAIERDLDLQVYALYGPDDNDIQLLEGQTDVESQLAASLELTTAATS
jgi:hypothetical protein